MYLDIKELKKYIKKKKFVFPCKNLFLFFFFAIVLVIFLQLSHVCLTFTPDNSCLQTKFG